MTTDKIIPDRYKGILLIIASAFCFAFMNAFVRLAGDLPAIEKSFFRNFVAVFFALGILLKKRTPLPKTKGDYGYLFLRASTGTLGIICNFYAIGKLDLADASMLNKMSPFFVLLFSYVLLKESLTLFQAGAVCVAFAGCLFILRPSLHNVEFIPACIGLTGGICAGFAYTMVRKLGNRGVAGPFIVFFFSAFSCIATLPYLVLRFVPMSATQLLYLLGAGLAATGGQFTITAAYCYAPAREISVYDYSQIIFAAVLGFFLFEQIPDLFSFIGYFIICSTAVVMFFYNNRKQKNT